MGSRSNTSTSTPGSCLGGIGLDRVAPEVGGVDPLEALERFWQIVFVVDGVDRGILRGRRPSSCGAYPVNDAGRCACRAPRSIGQIQSRSDDAVGIDTVVAVDGI